MFPPSRTSTSSTRTTTRNPSLLLLASFTLFPLFVHATGKFYEEVPIMKDGESRLSGGRLYGFEGESPTWYYAVDYGPVCGTLGSSKDSLFNQKWLSPAETPNCTAALVSFKVQDSQPVAVYMESTTKKLEREETKLGFDEPKCLCFTLKKAKNAENPIAADICWLVSVKGTVNAYTGATFDIDGNRPFLGGVYSPNAMKAKARNGTLQHCEDYIKDPEYGKRGTNPIIGAFTDPSAVWSSTSISTGSTESTAAPTSTGKATDKNSVSVVGEEEDPFLFDPNHMRPDKSVGSTDSEANSDSDGKGYSATFMKFGNLSYADKVTLISSLAVGIPGLLLAAISIYYVWIVWIKKRSRRRKEKEVEQEIARYIEERKMKEDAELENNAFSRPDLGGRGRSFRDTAMTGPGEIRIFLEENFDEK